MIIEFKRFERDLQECNHWFIFSNKDEHTISNLCPRGSTVGRALVEEVRRGQSRVVGFMGRCSCFGATDWMLHRSIKSIVDQPKTNKVVHWNRLFPAPSSILLELWVHYRTNDDRIYVWAIRCFRYMKRVCTSRVLEQISRQTYNYFVPRHFDGSALAHIILSAASSSYYFNQQNSFSANHIKLYNTN